MFGGGMVAIYALPNESCFDLDVTTSLALPLGQSMTCVMMALIVEALKDRYRSLSFTNLAHTVSISLFHFIS